MFFELFWSVLTVTDIANQLLKIKAIQKHIKLIWWNSPYLSLDTITSLKSCPFNQCLIDATVEVKVNLFQNRILLKKSASLQKFTKTIILKSSVIITEKYKINHNGCQSQYRFVYLYDLVPYKCKIPGRYEYSHIWWQTSKKTGHFVQLSLYCTQIKIMIKNINLRSCLKPDAQRLHKIYF